MKRRWLKALFAFSPITIFLGPIALLVWSLEKPVSPSLRAYENEVYKHFAWNKNRMLNFKDVSIPVGLAYSIPGELNYDTSGFGVRPDSVLHAIKIKPDFVLYNSFQQGLFEYDFWMHKIDSGEIYLKIFEVTHNYWLNVRCTWVKIYNPADSLMRFGTTSSFMMDEGDRQKPFAARFEVWFKPADDTTERKLFVKTYKILGGWER